MAWTNKGAYRMLDVYLRNGTEPTNFYIRLVTSATAPTVDTNTASQLTEIAAGNGYTAGGYSLARNSTDFDTLTENDTNDRGECQIKDVTWTASGGSIPASGNGARYAVITDDNATDGSREIIAFWDLTSDRSVTTGNPFTLSNLELRAATA